MSTKLVTIRYLRSAVDYVRIVHFNTGTLIITEQRLLNLCRRTEEKNGMWRKEGYYKYLKCEIMLK